MVEASTMVIRCYELVIFFFFLKRWSEPWELFTVLKSRKFNCGSNGFMLFVHRTVLVVKRTVLVRGFRLSRSDCTVWSGSENHEEQFKISQNSFISHLNVCLICNLYFKCVLLYSNILSHVTNMIIYMKATPNVECGSIRFNCHYQNKVCIESLGFSHWEHKI